MTSFAKTMAADDIEYPTSDGKPMAETEIHLRNMLDLIASLSQYYRDVKNVYVAGNMLMFYVPGDKRKHVSPDVFVVRGIDKHIRDNYLVWAEGKGPDFVIELTSSSTRVEDKEKKFKLYRDVLKVNEYFLFDPKAEYLKPALQGYRLVRGRYAAIRLTKGRLPSRVLGLQLEQIGSQLRLFDPNTGKYLLTPEEHALAGQKAEAARQEAEAARQEAETALQEAETALQESEAARRESEAARAKSEREAENLRKELEALRKERTS